MEAISRLEKSGLSVTEIAAAAQVGPAAVRRWKRNECAPNTVTRRKLTDLASARGLLLLATDFDLADISADQAAA